jgi:hypothetical protein
MMRRAHWLAAVGLATLGLAGLAGCQSAGGYPSGSWSGERSMVRAAEPDDPSSLPSLELHAIQTADSTVEAEDPFAPITVEQFLPATSRGDSPVTVKSHTAPAGYLMAPSGSAPSTLVPPAPMAVTAPMPAHPLAIDAHSSWEPHESGHGACSQCGHSSGGCSLFTGMVENMVIFLGGDYFSNSGRINRDRLLNKTSDPLIGLNVTPIDVPDLDPHRAGGMLSINAGAPLTPDGDLAFQIGGTYIEADEGGQGFFTTGIFHRCEPGDTWGINWGLVYDIAYDDFIDYVIGQIRFKGGYAITSRDEVGGWLSIGTHTEEVFLSGTHFIQGDPLQLPEPDVYEARVRPECHGYFFWRHVFMSGCDGTIYVGGRENLGGAFTLGYTASVPIGDSCAVMGGGHWSTDSDDRGSYDAYVGIGYYPGNNARSTGACGNRYLPYLEPANNNVMPMSINPRLFQILNVPQGTADHVRL